MCCSSSRSVAAWRRLPPSRNLQPAVSDVIATLEGEIGVKLFDRKSHGVEPTIYGQALLKRSLNAFDELKQGIRDIDFLADPTSGELRIGCGTSLFPTIMPPIIHQFSQAYPRAKLLSVDEIPPPAYDLSGLRERHYDLLMGRWCPTSAPVRQI